MANEVKKLVSEDDGSDTEADRDSNSAYERPNRSTLRNSQQLVLQYGNQCRHALCKIMRRNWKACSTYCYLFYGIFWQQARSAITEGRESCLLMRHMGYLSASLILTVCQVGCAKEQFRDYLLDPWYGLRVYIATSNSTS